MEVEEPSEAERHIYPDVVEDGGGLGLVVEPQ
jgi:hypothetical protein